MPNSDGSPAPPRRRHIVRLALFAAFLLGVFYLVAVMRVVDVEAVRRTVAATGPAAPLAYVVVSAALGAVFVPGPILAAGSGLLFGPLLGTLVTLGATVGTATIASLIGRRAGRDSARALLGAERADRLDERIERGGLWAVVGQRFIPASPMRWPPTRSALSEFHCGRWPSEPSSARRHAPSSTPRSAHRSQTCRHPWRTSPSRCGA